MEVIKELAIISCCVLLVFVSTKEFIIARLEKDKSYDIIAIIQLIVAIICARYI